MIEEFTGEPVTKPLVGRGHKSDLSLSERKRIHYLSRHEHYKSVAREKHHRQNTQRDIERITAWKHANPNRVARSRLLKNAKVRATALGLAFDLTLEDITLPEVCPVLGIQIVFGRGQVQPGSPTVDRVVPERGYVRGNICVISHRANQIKSNGTIAEHEAVLRYMRERA